MAAPPGLTANKRAYAFRRHVMDCTGKPAPAMSAAVRGFVQRAGHKRSRMTVEDKLQGVGSEQWSNGVEYRGDFLDKSSVPTATLSRKA